MIDQTLKALWEQILRRNLSTLSQLSSLHQGYLKKGPYAFSTAFQTIASTQPPTDLVLGSIYAIRGVFEIPAAKESVHGLLIGIDKSEVVKNAPNEVNGNVPQFSAAWIDLITLDFASYDVESQIKPALKLLSKALNIFPCLQHINIEASVANSFVYKLAERHIWSSLVRFSEYYAKHLTIIHISELYHLMVADAVYEVCCDLLISQQNLHTDNAEYGQMQQLASNFIDECIRINNKISLTAAGKVVDAYQMGKSAKTEISLLMTKLSIATHVRKGKWQLAEQICRNMELLVYLYDQLVAAELYIESKSIFDKYHMTGHVTPVSDTVIEQQLEKQRNDYISLPIPLNQVIIVQDAASLSIASIGLLDVDISTSGAAVVENYRYVGVDAEWRAVMTAKGKPNTQGASILQLSTPQYVYIFDFQVLATDELLVAACVRILRAVFGSEYIIKVGWGFAHNDRTKVQLASGGQFAECIETLVGVLEVDSMVMHYLRTKQPKHKPIKKTDTLSLSDGCEKFFGKPLSKSERTSNWEERPLQRQQICYAALDAHATLAVFDAVVSCLGYDVSSLNGGVSEMYGFEKKGHQGKLKSELDMLQKYCSILR